MTLNWGGYFEAVKETMEEADFSWEKMIELDPIFYKVQQVENEILSNWMLRPLTLSQITDNEQNKLNSPFLDSLKSCDETKYPYSIVKSKNCDVLKFFLEKGKNFMHKFAQYTCYVDNEVCAKFIVENFTINMQDFLHDVLMYDAVKIFQFLFNTYPYVYPQTNIFTEDRYYSVLQMFEYKYVVNIYSKIYLFLLCNTNRNVSESEILRYVERFTETVENISLQKLYSRIGSYSGKNKFVRKIISRKSFIKFLATTVPSNLLSEETLAAIIVFKNKELSENALFATYIKNRINYDLFSSLAKAEIKLTPFVKIIDKVVLNNIIFETCVQDNYDLAKKMVEGGVPIEKFLQAPGRKIKRYVNSNKNIFNKIIYMLF